MQNRVIAVIGRSGDRT